MSINHNIKPRKTETDVVHYYICYNLPQNTFPYLSTEHFMVQQMVPKEFFDKILALKSGEGMESHNIGSEGVEPKHPPMTSAENNTFDNSIVDQGEEGEIERELHALKAELESKYKKEEVDAIYAVVKEETKQVMDIMKTEGGDLQDVIAQVRKKTRQKQLEAIEDARREMEESGYVEAIIDEKEPKQK